MDEAILRKAALRGDEDAWRTLYDAHADGVYGYIYVRLNRNRARAEDAFQETWMIAVRKLRAFDPKRGPFDAWVKGIAANVVRNRSRYWARRDRTERADYTATQSTSLAAPQNGFVARALTEIPSAYRELLRDRYYEELSVGQIADRDGSSYKAIESRLSRARVAFREAYERIQHERENDER